MLNARAHHLSFPISDLAQSREFYEGVLGLEPIPRPDFPVDGIWYQAGDVQVHLIVTPPGVETAPPPPALNPIDRHSAFAVDSYDATLAFLKSKGLEVFETSPDVGQMWVRDPDGHIIELIVDTTLEQRMAAGE